MLKTLSPLSHDRPHFRLTWKNSERMKDVDEVMSEASWTAVAKKQWKGFVES